MSTDIKPRSRNEIAARIAVDIEDGWLLVEGES